MRLIHIIAMVLIAVLLTMGCSSIQEEAKQAACRSNMKSIAIAEEIYYARFGRGYTDAAGLESSDILGNALGLACPSCARAYEYEYDDDSYTVKCSCVPTHGTVTDLRASWQGETL